MRKRHLLLVLKSHKRAIAWKLSDIKGVSPEFCTHKILMEEDYEPSVQSQRRVNPKIHDVIKKEVEKLLDAGLIYPISDSPWVSPVHCVPKKGGMTVITNEENEADPTSIRSRDGEFQLIQRFRKTTASHAYELLLIIAMLLGYAMLRARSKNDLRLIELSQSNSKTPSSDSSQRLRFVFSEECVDSFTTLKKIDEAPILIAPDWDLPFELMCDASDFAIGAVLGQRKNKHFQPIHLSVRIPQVPNRYGYYIDIEEYQLGDLNEPPNYKAALVDSESDKWLKAMNTKMKGYTPIMEKPDYRKSQGAKIPTKERIFKKRTKNEAKTTKPDSDWKSRKKTKSKSKPKPEKVNRKSTQVNPEAKSQEK
ncbi:reverse transcriptase domain-containing protein [Tanacetum coccineum]|uniref:Reverse transcriptase domain-containing protein n=1 Tax=Tanacetum coccineum TaxID=301880 RepID=A0ABQ5ICB8_9ASTR